MHFPFQSKLLFGRPTNNELPAKLYQDRRAFHSHPCVRDVSGYETPVFYVLTIAVAPAAHYIYPTSCTAFPQPYGYKIAVKMTKQFRLHTQLISTGSAACTDLHDYIHFYLKYIQQIIFALFCVTHRYMHCKMQFVHPTNR